MMTRTARVKTGSDTYGDSGRRGGQTEMGNLVGKIRQSEVLTEKTATGTPIRAQTRAQVTDTF